MPLVGPFILLQKSYSMVREHFTDFLAHVNEMEEQKVDPGPTKEMLIKQLVWERINVLNHNVVTLVHNKNIHKWILATRVLTPVTVPLLPSSFP